MSGMFAPRLRGPATTAMLLACLAVCGLGPWPGAAQAQTASTAATGADAASAATSSVGPSTWNDLADTRGAPAGAMGAVNSLLPGATAAAPQNMTSLDIPKASFLYPLMSDGLVQASAQGHVLLTPDTPEQSFRIFVPVLTEAVNMRLMFRNTIDILPEKSSLEIVVNDRVVGQIQPRNFKGFAPLDLELPRDALRAGENKVTLRAALYHRIACSPETTFSLQVELDPSQSGVSTDVAADPSKIDNPMPLILATALAKGSVDVRTSSPADTAFAESLSAALTQQMAVNAPQVSASFPVTSVYEPAPTTVSTVPPVHITLRRAETRGVQIRVGDGGGYVVVVSYDDATPIEDLTAKLLPRITPMTTTVPPLPVARVVHLSDLNVGTLIASSLFQRQRVEFSMPDNWLALDGRRAYLWLTYTAATVTGGEAQLTVKVNGNTVGLFDLSRDRKLKAQRLTFPANILSPGPNELVFESQRRVSDPNQACQFDTADYLSISPDTALRVPEAPKMAARDLNVELRKADWGGIIGAMAKLASDTPMALPDTLGLRLYALDGSLGRADAVMGLPPIDIETILSPPAPAPAVVAPKPAEDDGIPDNDDETAAQGPQVSYIDWITDNARAILGHALHDQTAEEWSDGLHGRALLVLGPDRKTPPLLIVRNTRELRGILLNLMMVAGHQNGPRASLSVLTDGGSWVSWQDRSQMPTLLEKLTWQNISEVAGAYASWQPRLFLAALGALCLIFAAFFTTYMIFSRRVR